MKIIRPTAIRDSGGSFTRASTATYHDSAGILQTAGVNIPRINYNPETLTHTGLLLESQATNMLTYSEEFDNAAWSVAGAGTGLTPVVTANAGVAPDGSSTADRVVFDKGAGTTSTDQSRLFNSSAATVTGQPYAITVWMKSATANNYLIRLDLNGQGSTDADFPSLVTVTPVWKRFEIRVNSATDAVRWLYIRLRGTTGSSDYADVYIWGAQQENSIAATSYIKTTTAPAIRYADVVTGTGMLYTDVEEAPVTLLTKPEIFVTQSPTVSAQSYVLSFYGTGLLTLSGVYSGTLSGTGVNNRVYLVFTPTAGTLTITLSSTAGSVTNAQLEVGTVLGPYINETLWNSGTTYTAYQRVSRTTSGTHNIYQSVAGGLSSIPPENAPTAWSLVSSTNRWQLFDETISTSTKRLNSMTYLLVPGRINSLAVLGVSAADITISLVLPSTGEIVYASSADLNNGVTVGDWYQYFYEPIYQQEALAITNLLDAVQLEIPAYGDAVLAVTFNYPSNIVEIGALVVGLSADIGSTQNAPTVGIIDYSKKDTDIFGNTNIIVRNFSKRVNAKVAFKSTLTDNINQILSQYRSTPLVWVGADNLYTSLIVYGFYRDYDITIDNIIMSTCNLTIEGLT